MIRTMSAKFLDVALSAKHMNYIYTHIHCAEEIHYSISRVESDTSIEFVDSSLFTGGSAV